MVKNPIKVYGRLKPVFGKSAAEDYDIRETSDDSETLTFNLRGSTSCRNDTYSFRFQKVFTESDGQEKVFNTVARPVVDSVLQGYNGTLFAYGQTGSGKTFAITGGAGGYEERGIIPRTIQHIFHRLQQSDVVHTTCISYLEIYNECGYDLLNAKHRVSRLDDLPKVTLLEDTNGNLHLRNLSVHPVSSEEEALNLLFFGDTNRMISETPMNQCSSRSHCVFTVHLLTRNAHAAAVRRSKLHIVDLAGSERVHKSGIDGNILMEARHINLSLHFLEQVIVALAESKRVHVPYRNSMMTTVLRDSLGGNCMTAMLATLSLERTNIEETLSTCRFSQRVALVRNEALLNEERDPQLEISILRADVRRLREQIAALTTTKDCAELSCEEMEECRAWVRSFLRNNGAEPTQDDVGPLADPRKVNLCFSLLRDAANSREDNECLKDNDLSMPRNTVDLEVEKYKDIIKQRDSEISILISLLRKEKGKKEGECSGSLFGEAAADHPTAAEHTVIPDEFEPLQKNATTPTLPPDECDAFKKFIADRKNRFEIEIVKEGLRNKFEAAKKIAASIETNRETMNTSGGSSSDRILLPSEQLDPNNRTESAPCPQSISSSPVSQGSAPVNLNAELKQLQQGGRSSTGGQENTPNTKVQGKIMSLKAQLEAQQVAYRQGLLSLQVLKVETEHQKHAMEQAKIRLLQNFRAWWNENKQHKEHSAQVSTVPIERRNRTLANRSNASQHHRTSTNTKSSTSMTPSHQLNNLRRYANELQLISNPSKTREDEDTPNPGRALTRIINTPTFMPSVSHDDHAAVANEGYHRPRSCHGASAHRTFRANHTSHVSREKKHRPTSAGTVLDCAPVKDALEELPRKLERYVTTTRDPDKVVAATHPYRLHRERVSSFKGGSSKESRPRTTSSGAKDDPQVGHLRKVALTGDPEIDKEIVDFYEARSRVYQNK